MIKGNLLQELEQVKEYWSPRIVGRVNDQYIKVAKLKGDLTWHKHDNEDEMFFILRGQLVSAQTASQALLSIAGQAAKLS